MKNILKVKEYMTSSPHTIGSDQKIEVALKLMSDFRIRHLPILKGGQLVGLIAERDIRLVEALEGIDPNLIRVEDVMSPETYTVAPNASLDQVAFHMAENKIGSAIVVEKEKVIGIFTAIDGLKTLSHILRKD